MILLDPSFLNKELYELPGCGIVSSVSSSVGKLVQYLVSSWCVMRDDS